MIPKIIHHIWMGDNEIPKICLQCIEQSKRLHPDFEFKLWRDKDAEKLMKTEFQDYYENFHKLPRTIMKIDMFRYFLMYKFGGIYTDLDYYFIKKFDLLEWKLVIPCNREDEAGSPIRLGNCIFASEPKNIFWKHLIDTLNTIDRSNLDYKNDSFIDKCDQGTGPQFVYSMWLKYPKGIYVPKRKLFHPETKNDPDYIESLKNTETYGMHVCTGLWRNNKL
tara:strand:- start:452 stop:1114 length:663 start_codon:yes stop_codon:yes gene_type:complete